jgi:cytochrome c peroxidase
MKRRYALIFLLLPVIVSAFIAIEKPSFFIPKNWPKPVYDFKRNPINTDVVALGRVLFYDPLLSKDNSISCASCHSNYNAFTHVDHKLSHGIGDSIGFRNSPAIMNLAWSSTFMWDGAINHLDMQALAPITHPREMGESFTNVVEKLKKSKLYPTLFKSAFQDSIISGERTLKALSQFMLTLISANSKYDSVMNKQTLFTHQENNGYRLFKKSCASCHQEPLFTNYTFKNNGLSVDPDLNDNGRMRITKLSEDSLKFKVPTLRNLTYSFPYMHDGRFKKLSEVMNHYVSGVQKSKTLSPELAEPIHLNDNEKVDIIAFLLTLSDKQFVFNPQFAFPKEILLKAEND